MYMHTHMHTRTHTHTHAHTRTHTHTQPEERAALKVQLEREYVARSAKRAKKMKKIYTIPPGETKQKRKGKFFPRKRESLH